MTPTRRARRRGTPVPMPITLLAILAAVAACATPAGGPGGSGSVLTGDGTQLPQDRLHRQAHDALARWASAIRKSGGASIAFVGDLTGQVGTWEGPVGENNKAALAAGLVEAGAALSDNAPSRDKVRWLDGSEARRQRPVGGRYSRRPGRRGRRGRLMPGLPSPRGRRGAAGDGPRRHVTRPGKRARLGVLDRGLLREDHANRRRPERDGRSATVERQRSARRHFDRVRDWDERLEEARRLFIGKRDGADKQCGADYAAEAVESDLAVVVIVRETRTGAGACDLVGYPRTAKVTLESVLGTRAVLEVRQGLPVSVAP